MANPADKYTLPRDAAESDRLNLQHRLNADNVGFLLHPHIQAAISDDAHIADVGTGTGAWLEELRQTAPPSWKFTGFDLSDAQFPKPTPNDRREFHLLNILEPIPEKWKNQFDVVHIRLIVLALKGQDWQTVLENAVQLMKPGGWLQWQEHDLQDRHVVQSVPGVSRYACREIRIRRAKTDPDPLLTEHVLERPARAKDMGLQNVFEDVFSQDRLPSAREIYTSQTTRASASIMRQALKKDPSWAAILGTEEEINELERQALEECKDGKVYVQYRTHIVTAQKPL